MFGIEHYVPVLKWKQGEQRALADLGPSIRSRVTPLLEIPPIPLDLDSHEPKRSLEEHVNAAVEAMKECWSVEAVFFLDTHEISDDRTADGKSGARAIFQEATRLELQFVPVIALDRNRSEVGTSLRFKERGICLRLSPDQLDDGNDLDEFVVSATLRHEEIDIVIDLGDIGSIPQGTVRVIARNSIKALPEIGRWRTVTLVATAFPQSMGAISANQVSRVLRTEWQIWNDLLSKWKRSQRLPTFGDYGIQHPDLIVDFDPRFMQMSAAIRYALNEEWLLVKGESLKKGGDQYHRLAAKLISTPGFKTASHCQGCLSIQRIADKDGGSGNATTWRRIGTCHHITLTVEQIADAVGSAANP